MRAPQGRLAVMAALLTAGCAAGTAAPPSGTVVWSGTVHVGGVETVPGDTTLEIRPGTRVRFSYLDLDGDGQGDSGLIVEGRIIAEGTREEPIVFEPEGASGSPALWGEVRIESKQPSRFAHCRFRGARTAIHSHLAPLEVASCNIEGNLVGLRFRGDPVRISGSRFRGNGTAIRYWESSPEIFSNIISANDTGIFCRQGSPGTVVRGNSFLGNRDYHIKLGELQSRDVDARGNYWGEDEHIEEKVFDRNDVPYLGRMLYEPRLEKPALPEGDREGPA